MTAKVIITGQIALILTHGLIGRASQHSIFPIEFYRQKSGRA